MFLLMIGIAYFFALLHTYYTHEGRDGQPGLSVKDVMIAYNGAHEQTRLGAAVMGSMAFISSLIVTTRFVISFY